MRHSVFSALVLGLALAIGSGCDAIGGDGGTVTITGQVIDDKQNPVVGAFVEVLPMGLLIETTAGGTYSLDVEVDSTMRLTVIASKNGFSQNQVTVLAIPDRVLDVPTLQISPQGLTETEVSGMASNISFSGQSTSVIGVTESGSQEIASIVFVATDSLGNPLSLAQALDINFAIATGPGGGEFLHPATVRTNARGEAEVNLSSGTRAGVVQIEASASVGGRTIRSLPVAVTIHGGLPDQAHFSLGPAKFNFPGLTAFGLTDAISVIVGDKFSNPARPGTAVYFSTNFGVIQGSVNTGPNGEGAVQLFSGNPLPPDGVTIVSSITSGTNGVDGVDDAELTSQIPVLMTGGPIITLTLTGSGNNPFFRTYDYTVHDRNVNPLAENTTISAAAGGTKVKAVGDTNVRLGDTVFLNGGMTYADVLRGPGITEFSFAVVEDEGGDSTAVPVLQTVTIAVSSPNGNLQLTYGAGGVMSSTRGAIVEQITANKMVARLPDNP